MGYSITQEQHEKLERNRRDGRLCCFSTGRGGCFNRATMRQTQESFTYKLDEGNCRKHEMVACSRHALPVGYEGVNFRIVASARF